MRRVHGFVLALAVVSAGAGAAPPTGDPHLATLAAEHEGDTPVPSASAERAPAGAVEGAEVVYARQGGTPVRGYLARPKGEGSAPGILLIHEWWGLNDNLRSMARQLAGQGYAALAVDLYGGAVASDPQEARALVGKVIANPEAARENLRQAHGYLSLELRAPRIGAVGWCFGGGWSLQTALLLPGELDAAVIYYGRLETDPDRLRGLDTPLLGHFASEDRAIPVADVRAFEQALEELDKPASIHIYEGAQHAFANPSGTRYDAEAAEQAWQRTLSFFDGTLRGETSGGASP
ncbi:MAG: dienelactone hydrolase family protein [Myxococcota bacterium]